MVKFAIDPGDVKIIKRIAARAKALLKDDHRDILHFEMDISATHAGGCPLRLADLLAADDFNFLHDIVGIEKHLDRTTGQLDGRFIPRFAAPRQKAMSSDLREQVFEALDNAIENGYGPQFSTMTDREIAEDLADCAAHLEGKSLDIMAKFVAEWRDEGRIRCPKCGQNSGDSWGQCEGCCPMPMSPHYDPRQDRSRHDRG